MRYPRFDELFSEVLTKNPDPALVKIETFGEIGYAKVSGRDGHPLTGGAYPDNRRLTFSTGGQVYIQFVHSSPPGGDNYLEPERIVEADKPLDPVPVPAIDTSSGSIRIADVQAWLLAGFRNAGSREIVEVSPGSGGSSAIIIKFANGAGAYGIWVHTLRRGQQADPKRECQPVDVI